MLPASFYIPTRTDAASSELTVLLTTQGSTCRKRRRSRAGTRTQEGGREGQAKAGPVYYIGTQ